MSSWKEGKLTLEGFFWGDLRRPKPAQPWGHHVPCTGLEAAQVPSMAEPAQWCLRLFLFLVKIILFLWQFWGYFNPAHSTGYQRPPEVTLLKGRRGQDQAAQKPLLRFGICLHTRPWLPPQPLLCANQDSQENLHLGDIHLSAKLGICKADQVLHNPISSPHLLCQARQCFPCCALIQLLTALLGSATPNPHNSELLISVAQLPTKESLIKALVFIISSCIPIPGMYCIPRLQIW